MKKILLALVAAAVLVPAAAAGGFATVGLTALPGDDIAAGGTWSTDLMVKAHGRTPADGLSPVVRIRNGDVVREFAATPTGKPGVYHVDVVFPAGGMWTYEIDDGYSQTHTFKPVEVQAASGPSSFPTVPVGGIALALLLAGALALFLRRSRHAPRPAPLSR
jgi:hypothetical protein